MGRKNSKRKGNAFENKICKLFLDWTGERWKRTILSGGSWEKGDITPANRKSNWVIELKNRESWNFHDLWTGKGPLFKWLTKLEEEAKDNPHLLIAKKSRRPVLVLIPAEHCPAPRPAPRSNDTPPPDPLIARSADTALDAWAAVHKFGTVAAVRVRGRKYLVLRLDQFLSHVDGSFLFSPNNT